MQCFTYVFPCQWEDHCKVGFSRDPLARLQAFHARWFETFDLQRSFLIETESEREARDLELQLRRPLAIHKAPQPTTIRQAAGGHSEWLRGAFPALAAHGLRLEAGGYRVHRPGQRWLADRLAARSDRLYSWSDQQWSAAQLVGEESSRLLDGLRNTLDAYVDLGLEPRACLPDEVAQWYFGTVPGE